MRYHELLKDSVSNVDEGRAGHLMRKIMESSAASARKDTFARERQAPGQGRFHASSCYTDDAGGVVGGGVSCQYRVVPSKLL